MKHLMALSGFLICSSATCLFGQAGFLDSSFAANGVSIMISGDISLAADMMLQDDGKILVVGQVDQSVSHTDYGVARFSNDGSIDVDFGDNGVATINFYNDVDREEIPTSVLIDTNGKIVVGGYVRETIFNPNFAIVRFNADGTADQSFGTNGKVSTDIYLTENSYATGVLLQNSSKLILTGYAYAKHQPDKNDDFALIRYLDSGTIDSSFGTNGAKLIDFNDNNGDKCYGSTRDPDGKIIMVGSTTDLDIGYATSTVVLRLNADGIIDSSFGTNGSVQIPVGNGIQYLQSVIVLTDSKIAAMGRADISGFKLVLIRLNNDGSVDSTFDDDGVATYNLPADAHFYGKNDLVIQSDGKLVTCFAVDSDTSGNYIDFGLARFNENGSIDSTFGIDGLMINDFGGTEDVPCGVALQQDGKILVGGSIEFGFAVARYLNDLFLGEITAMKDGQLFIYPNPVNDDFLTLSYELNETAKVSCELSDINGQFICKLMNSSTHLSGKYAESLTLPAGLGAGSYIVSLHTNQKTLFLKIVIY